MPVTVTGVPDTVRRIRHAAITVPLAVEAGLFEHGSKVEGDAKELVPVDFGALRASGFTLTNSLQHLETKAEPSDQARSLSQNVGTEIRAVVGFGGPSTPYALAVHENPRSGKTEGWSPPDAKGKRRRYQHWAAVGQWKYLEQPAKARAKEMAGTIRRHVDRALGALERLSGFAAR